MTFSLYYRPNNFIDYVLIILFLYSIYTIKKNNHDVKIIYNRVVMSEKTTILMKNDRIAEAH